MFSCMSCDSFFHWSSAKFKDPRKFAEGKSGDEMPDDQKPADEKPGDDKSGSGKSVTVNSKPEDFKPTYDNMESFEFNPSEDKPAETMSVDEKPADTK
ncbi:hypothetical protein BDP55DRAFT_133220 [Colletotrichum godetiae]|uniref:Uncharacterized protein n=1 Tax=Colletotrichum godetiae TaxID=1209918 RepID=A0AAJ0AZ49_9PEZI|nr:uncharacterized protein BDP55DRAFT_133220 [Colletotrichum godetiae]KAK1700481.1 hypothetical protein BDP55DRAFT_133220 [Colletotrichum godetiae]